MQTSTDIPLIAYIKVMIQVGIVPKAVSKKHCTVKIDQVGLVLCATHLHVPTFGYSTCIMAQTNLIEWVFFK